MNESQQLASALARAAHALEAGREVEALTILDAVDEARWTSVEYWGLRAEALFRLNQPADGVEAANWGLSIAPFSAELYAIRFEGEATLGDLAAAERSILEAIRLGGKHPYVLVRYAELLIRAGQVDKAMQVNADGRASAPDDEALMLQSARLEFLRGDDSAAIATARRVAELYPDSAEANFLVGVFTAEAVGSAASLESLRKSIALGLPDPERRAAVRHDVAVASHPAVRPYYAAIERIGHVRFLVIYGIIVLGLLAADYWKWSLGLVALFWLAQGYIFAAERIAARKARRLL